MGYSVTRQEERKETVVVPVDLPEFRPDFLLWVVMYKYGTVLGLRAGVALRCVRACLLEKESLRQGEGAR